MKLFISVDIEGITGIVNWDETHLGKSDYGLFQKRMNQEVAAACIGASNAGCSEIVVRDAHGSARNLIHEELPENVKLIRGWTGHPFVMMDGLDESFDAAIFIGYHTGTGRAGNPLAHALSGDCRIYMNEELLTEFDINAMIASYMKVPVTFLSGDAEICQIAESWNEQIKTVAVHQGMFGGIISEHPRINKREIELTVESSLKNAKELKVKPLPDYFKLKIVHNKPHEAYARSFYPGAKFVEPDTILFETADFFEALKAINFLSILITVM